MNGPVLDRALAGRLREALAPGAGAPDATPGVDDFLAGRSGTVGGRRDVPRAADLATARCDLEALRRRTPPRAAAAGARGRDPAGPGGSWSRRREELLRSRHEVTPTIVRDGRPREVRAAHAQLDGSPTARRRRLAARARRRRRAAARLPRPLPGARRAPSACAWPSPRTGAARTPPGRSPAGRPGQDVRRTRFVEIGPVTALHRGHVRRAAAVPRAAHGLGPGRALGRAGAASTAGRVGVVDATPVRHTRPRRRAYDRGGAVAEARAFLAERPYVTRDEADAGQRRRSGEGRRSCVRVLPPGERPGARRVGAPPGDGRPRRRRRRARPRAAPAGAAAARRAEGPRAAAAAARELLRQPRRAELDGLQVRVRAVRLAAAAALLRHVGRVRGAVARASRCARLRRSFPFDLVHAHNAVPAGRGRAPGADPARRSSSPSTAATSSTRRRARGRQRPPSRAALGTARLVLANSAGIERMRRGTARAQTRVVHLGADLPGGARRTGPRADAREPSATSSRASATPTCCARLAPARPALRRRPLRRRRRRAGARAAARARRASSGSPSGSTFAGQLRHDAALAPLRRGTRLRRCPSTDEAFGVAYVEAMAGRLPAIGALGEPGPEEISGAGERDGPRAARRPRALAEAIDEPCWTTPRHRAALGALARRHRARELLVGGAAGGPPSAAYRDGPVVSAARPASSPTTCRPTASARSARCTSGSASSWPCSAGARTTRPRPSRDPGVPAPADRRSADVMRSPPAGDYRAVVCGTAGRIALPGRLAGARRAGVPFVLWSALWAHPRSPAHLAGSRRCAAIYRDADAVVAYGPHVAGVRPAQRGAARPRCAPGGRRRRSGARRATRPPAWRRARISPLFVGRRRGRQGPGRAAGRVASAPGSPRPTARSRSSASGDGCRSEPGSHRTGVCARNPADLYRRRTFVVMPSSRTSTFREPWGLVANEAMHAGHP